MLESADFVAIHKKLWCEPWINSGGMGSVAEGGIMVTYLARFQRLARCSFGERIP